MLLLDAPMRCIARSLLESAIFFYSAPGGRRYRDRIDRNQCGDRDVRPGQAFEVQIHGLGVLDLRRGHGERPRGRHRNRRIDQISWNGTPERPRAVRLDSDRPLSGSEDLE
jgi:hypothetical protein